MYFYCIIKPNKCDIYEDVADGLADGKSFGFEKGSHQKALETAQLMRQRAYPVAEICLMTGLTQNEVRSMSNG